MRLAFDDYELDIQARSLKKGSIEIHMEPQVFDLIAHLAQNHERMVSHDEIIETVWSGRIVSDSAIASRINAARAAIGDNGKDQKKIRTIRGKGFRFCVEPIQLPSPVHPAENEHSPEDLFGTPSIAALPFAVMPESQEIGYFADGIVEDLIRNLSRFRELAVISRNTSFSFRESPTDVVGIGKSLKVKYVLSGSVRHSANQVRISVELIETSTSKQIWSERYDRELKNAFDVQDDVAARAVSAIAPQTQFAEMTAAFRKDAKNLSAWEQVMRARWHMDKHSRVDTENALRILNGAKVTNPDLAILHSTQALCHLHLMLNAWAKDPLREITHAKTAAQLAVDLDRNDSNALAILGLAAMFGGRMDECLDLLDEAQRYNPNLANAYGFKATTYGCLGRLEETLSNHDRATSLSPLDFARPFWMSGKGIALFLSGQYSACLQNAEKMLRIQQGYGPALRQKAASHAMLDQSEQAKQTLRQIRSEMPGLTIERIRNMVPIVNEADQDHWLGALRRAGLPD